MFFDSICSDYDLIAHACNSKRANFNKQNVMDKKKDVKSYKSDR